MIDKILADRNPKRPSHSGPCPFPLYPKKDFSTHYMKADIITRILAHCQGSLISNGKAWRQECLKDYPSAMLSTSTFQEWNGTTVTLWKVSPLHSLVSRFHFFHFDQCHGIHSCALLWHGILQSLPWQLPHFGSSQWPACQPQLDRCCRNCAGWGIHPNKVEGPSTCFTVLGIKLNSVRLLQVGYQQFRSVHVGARN